MNNDAPKDADGMSAPEVASQGLDTRPAVKVKETKPFMATAKGSFFLALTSVVSASFISVCSTPILDQLKAIAAWDFTGNFSHSIWAFVLAIVALTVVFIREQALNTVTAQKEADLVRQSEAMKADLARQSKDMEGRLTHMPPRQFIQEYVDTQSDIGLLRRLVKNDPGMPRDEIVRHTRAMLEGILALTRLWDGVAGTNKFVTYQTNIMLVFSNDEVALDELVLPAKPPQDTATPCPEQTSTDRGAPISKELDADDILDAEDGPGEADELKEQVEAVQPTASKRGNNGLTQEEWYMHDHFFLHNQNYEVALARCSGLLLLQKELTVTSQPIDGESAEIRQVCLPFTFKGKFNRDFHHPNLPGAPRVAASGEPEYIHNTYVTMTQWVDDQRSEVPEINGRYRDKIRQYYRNLEHSKSILSMPIYHQGELIGILNVSKNAENMLLNADRADQFAQFMVPICYHLGKMLALLEAY